MLEFIKLRTIQIPLLLGLLLQTPLLATISGDPFQNTNVLAVRIRLQANDIKKLEQQPREYVPGRVGWPGNPFTNASVRLKGHGSFRPISEKASFSIEFPKHSFFGRKKLLLNNSSQDPSYIRWKLASELFQKARLPAARVNFAHVELNGKDLGLYILTEPTDREFLREHFGSDDGNLYEGDNVDVTETLEQDSGVKSSGQSDLKQLAKACLEVDLSKRWKLLSAQLDTERFASFMAMEVLITHHDGYSLDRNNFRIYHNPTSHRWVFIPHGMDLIFDRPKAPLKPDWSGLVAHAFMETPQGQALYRNRMLVLGKMVYGDDHLLKRVDELAARLRSKASSSGVHQDWERHVSALRAIIFERRTYVSQQLEKGDLQSGSSRPQRVNPVHRGPDR